MLVKMTARSDEETHVPQRAEAGRLFGPCVSPAMQLIESMMPDIAAADIPVLIAGETGTGKEVVALTIHQLSRRCTAPFIKLRCSGLKPEDFDHVLSAEGDQNAPLKSSTVLLDEISDISPECQLRLLESSSRLDEGSEKFQLGACVISTRCRNLEDAMRGGRLRRDLYYRLSGVCIWLPPLRQRKEDIVPLAEFFLARYSAHYGRACPQVSASIARRLCDRSWPGNVRELESAMKRIVAIGDEAVAFGEFGPFENSPPPLEHEASSLKEAARAASRHAERELILKVLARTRWNRKRVAEELRISYKALLYKLKQIGLEGPVS